MALTLRLTTENRPTENDSPGYAQVVARHAATILATTALAQLPDRAAALADPYTHGPTLYAALGGAPLLALLAADPDKLLYLDIPAGDPADGLAWECAVLPPKIFLVQRYGLLRRVDRVVVLDETPAALRLVALGADALVERDGQARTTFRLDILQEMQQIEQTLAASQKAVSGVRIAPTVAALRAALSDGARTLLHLACHGSVIETDMGAQPVLHLEDENGGPAKLLGDDLISLAGLADLRLILLSACRLGQALAAADVIQGRLTRALVEQGVPAAIGMQGLFPDNLSDELAAALYGSLLNGQPLGQALRAARLALSSDVSAVGLPVAYVAHGGDRPLPLPPGVAQRQRLDLSQHCRLPGAVQAPEPFVGRNAELHRLAQLAQTHKVITIIGTGGMGKTALAAAFARRFALRYTDGVLGYSFASNAVDAGSLRRALLLDLLGDEQADAPAERQEQLLLEHLRRCDLLLLIDNYESVQQANEDQGHPAYAQGQAVHGLLRKLANNGGRLLLTSRQQPAELRGERIFPGKDQLLQGVDDQAGAELFYQYSPRALESRHDPQVQRLARQVAQVTAGHPLAIALLGSEYHASDHAPDHFLDHWATELQAARSRALDDHHATFATAFSRSFAALSAESQARLQALSLIPFAFFATGAALLWGLAEADEDKQPTSRRHLRELVDRSLIEIDGYYTDNTPATWRFQPAVRQEAARRLSAAAQASHRPQLARYAAWLSRRAYNDIHQAGNSALVRHIRPTLATLAELADGLPGVERLRHLRRVGWLLNAFGRTREAHTLLTAALATAQATAPATTNPAEDAAAMVAVRSSLLHEIANLEVTRGDLDKALALYQESLALKEQIGDIQGKAASLHAMAQVFLTRGDLDKALALYQESLALKEQIGDIEGKAATLHQMAQVFLTRGDLDKALALYQEVLAVDEQTGEIQGKAATLHAMAQVFLTRGDLDKALALYQESLAVDEQIGDIQGKAATLHAMAQVFLTRGDLDKALTLYQESLALYEQIGDIQGKAASLHAMAQVFLTRGDLDKALALYQESLALKEQIGDIQGKAASLHQMAQVFLTRGDLDKALALYQESLALKEQIGDIQGKAASLHQMAQVFLTRGDLDKALALYQESLALKEQIGDIQGKAASLHAMAQVFLTRGDLDKALALYQESLALKEQIGDIKGKAASLHQMAQVFLTRGDLDKALALYQESLAVEEQIGNIKGKAATLSMMANVYWQTGDLAQAADLVQQSIEIAQELGDAEGLAFDTLKLGQIAQRRNDKESARRLYWDAANRFRQLGANHQVAEIQQMLSALEAEASTAAQPADEELAARLAHLSPDERAQLELLAHLRQALDGAQAAAQREQWPAAITYQEAAVAQARRLAAQTGDRAAQVQLSVLLYNLAGYYQQVNRHAAAVACYAEVVALDEATGHADLAADRQALAHAQALAAAQATDGSPVPPPPDLAAQLAQLAPPVRAALAQLGAAEQAQLLQALAQQGPEEQEQTLQALAHFATLPADEQAALVNRPPLQRVEADLFPRVAALLAAQQRAALDPAQQAASVQSLRDLQPQLAQDASLGAGRHDLVALLGCVVAYLQGTAVPPIPAVYAAVWAEWVER